MTAETEVTNAVISGDWAGAVIAGCTLASLIVIGQIVRGLRGRDNASHVTQSIDNGRELVSLRADITALAIDLRTNAQENEIKSFRPLLHKVISDSQGVIENVDEIKKCVRQLSSIGNFANNAMGAAQHTEIAVDGLTKLINDMRVEIAQGKTK